MGRPDLSGRWALNREKSRLEIPMPDATEFLIEHREPQFHLKRTHVTGNARDTFAIDLITNGPAVQLTHRGIDIQSRAYWEGDALVFDSAMGMGSERGTNIVRYALVDGGRTFVAVEKVRFAGHTHTNRWVFDRQ